jgi:hypothetical protein
MAVPDWSASVENVVASAAIIVGGGWAAWKWGYGETLRKRREFQDLDGTLTAASVALPGRKAYLTLQAVWRNPGPVAVNVCLDPEHSFVKQFELGADPPLGSFRMAGYPGAVEVAAVPMLPRPYTMGPQTESVMTEHFVVTVGSVYAFIWQVCQGPLSRKNQRHAQCDRELIWCSPPPATARTSRASPRVRTELPRATRPAARRKPTPSAPAGTGVSGGPVTV